MRQCSVSDAHIVSQGERSQGRDERYDCRPNVSHPTPTHLQGLELLQLPASHTLTCYIQDRDVVGYIWGKECYSMLPIHLLLPGTLAAEERYTKLLGKILFKAF